MALPPTPPGAGGNVRIPPRSSAIASRVHLPVQGEWPGMVRFVPFNDGREVILHRGGDRRDRSLDAPYLTRVGNAPIGAFVVEVLRHQQTLSPQPYDPARPPIDPAETRPVDDVLLLPDGELRIRRNPRGFTDAEVSRIVGSIELTSRVAHLPPAQAAAAQADYLPPEALAAAGPMAPAAPMAPTGEYGPPPGGGYGPPAGGFGPPPGALLPAPAWSQGGAAGAGPGSGTPGGAIPGTGVDVVLQANTFTVPTTCASCGAPKQTTRKTSLRKSQIGRAVTRTFEIPYCNACAARGQSRARKGILFGFVTLGISAAVGGLGFLVPGIPLVGLVVLALGVAVGFAVFVMTKVVPEAPPPPAVNVASAVRLVSFKGARSTLHCANPAWGHEFARVNGVMPLPAKRGDRFGMGALWIALLSSPAAALGTWFTAHPEVHVDNAGDLAMQIWIDGKPSDIVLPTPDGHEPPSIRVSYGKHTFGSSKVGAAGPESTVDGATPMNDAFLYNPGKTGCYWVVADSYGSATVSGVSQGPQALREFYAFDKVDTWFADNPQSVQVSNGQTGDTRIAVQRAKACMDLARRGCDLAARDSFIGCQRAAKSDEGEDACMKAVVCGRAAPEPEAGPTGTEPSATPTATHGPPRPTPHVPLAVTASAGPSPGPAPAPPHGVPSATPSVPPHGGPAPTPSPTPSHPLPHAPPSPTIKPH